MRIPFVPQGPIEPDQLRFIQASRGGSAFLYAGATFWLAAGLAGLVLDSRPAAWVYLVGGFSVPILGYLFARLQGVRLVELKSMGHFSLGVMAAAITPVCLPVLFALAAHDPRLVAPALTVIDSAHFPILMWIHLDYTYFLAAYAKFLLGLGFLFWWPEYALVAVGLLSAVISIAAGLAVDRAARDPQAAYAPNA